MKRSTGPALATLLSTLIAGFAMQAAPEPVHAGTPKVTICHKPPGNPANAHTISVNVHAWPAHKAHGDSLGDCSDDDIEGPASPGDPGGDGGDPDAGNGGGPGTGGSSAGGFSVELCDGRKGEQGRRIEVAGTGRVRVEPADCN